MGTEISKREARPLGQAVVEATAARLRILGEAKRVALLEALAEGEASVQELADRIGVPHQNASHHLSLLRRAGVVGRRADGPTAVYAIEDWSAWWVIGQLAGTVGEEAERDPG
ncbi:MAG TPA: metalloregulator ArsR/SmtB family transcription factor [Solirubrobacterales bacterium]